MSDAFVFHDNLARAIAHCKAVNDAMLKERGLTEWPPLLLAEGDDEELDDGIAAGSGS